MEVIPMRRILIALLTAVVMLGGIVLSPALAQDPQEQVDAAPGMAIFTNYPAQSAELGEIVTFPLTLRVAGLPPQVVRLEMSKVPEDWTVTFRGGGRIIQAAFVQPGQDATADLRLEPPQDVAAGTFDFVVVARGEGVEAELPIQLSLNEQLPPSLSLDVALPTLKGTPTTTFRYQATLRNEGDQDLTVNLGADTPEGFLVTIRSSGQEVTSLPLKANESRSLDVEVKLPAQISAGQYPINLQAQGGEAQATLALTAEVTGQPELVVTAPEGRLSGQAYAGRETPLKVFVQNTGSAAARNVELSGTAPSGWTIEFEPKQLPEIPAGQQVEVTANLRPSEKSLAGDYMATIRAQAEGGTSESADFRITVLTSTLWGIVGVALIAVAVGVVGLAVLRFGRR
jgi:uncharacterized membrane protein